MKAIKRRGLKYREDTPLHCHDCGYRLKTRPATSCPKCGGDRLSVKPRRFLPAKAEAAG